MKAWNLGNTTVRSPLRLQEGLRILVESPLHGNLIGRKQQQRFAQLLADNGIVNATRLQTQSDVDASDLGRKWHSALVKLGFVTPKLSRRVDEHGIDEQLRNIADGIPGLTGRPFELTPHGRSFLEAESVAAQQEHFLRSLVMLQMPSPLEGVFRGISPFSPLRIVLETLEGLEQQGLEPTLGFEEVRFVVQFVVSLDSIPATIEKVARFRHERAQASHKTRFDEAQAQRLKSSLTGQSLPTTNDYADSNLRYLKATGLFLAKGRGITIAPPRHKLIEQLLASPYSPLDSTAYLRMLWMGTPLPTDQPDQARETVLALVQALQASGEEADMTALLAGSAQDLQRNLHDLNDRYEQALERQYASAQRENWSDIAGYLSKLQNIRQREGPHIPRDQAAEYLEWAVWRAFLAIDSLLNSPWESRRFKFSVIEDVPISCAPGGGPDMLFEFNEFALVVEVTLTTGSRQVAAEGEPVHRHVADAVEAFSKSGKRVIGLFLAKEIDTNTAGTFQRHTWYGRDDREIGVDIVPLTLAQFTALFAAGFGESGSLTPQTIYDLLRACILDSSASPVAWKNTIGAYVNAVLHDLRAQTS